MAKRKPETAKLPVLATSLDVCTVCPDRPPINFEDRDDEKEPLTVYGMNGSYQVLQFSIFGVEVTSYITDSWRLVEPKIIL